MQKLTTLEKVSNKIDALSANCYDQNIDVPDISFENIETANIAGEPHTLRPIAQRSISNRLGIPYPYLKRCPENIQAMNLNHWITKEKNDQLLLRFDGNDIRAIFTPKYSLRVSSRRLSFWSIPPREPEFGHKGQTELNEKRLYTIRELVKEIGATEWFWRSQIWDGRLPYIQVGRKMFVDNKDIEKFICDHKKTEI